jgi:hypothetical protein
MRGVALLALLIVALAGAPRAAQDQAMRPGVDPPVL